LLFLLSLILLLNKLISTWAHISLQPANSLFSLEITHFFDRINALLSAILYVVIWIILLIFFNNCICLFTQDNHLIEKLWIIFPSLFLIKIAIPSLSILYMTDDPVDPSLIVKVNAPQWFWAYEYTDFYPSGVRASIDFDKYILPENGLTAIEFCLLETENRPVLSYSSMTQMLISIVDVLYSWAFAKLEVIAEELDLLLDELDTSNSSLNIEPLLSDLDISDLDTLAQFWVTFIRLILEEVQFWVIFIRMILKLGQFLVTSYLLTYLGDLLIWLL